MGAWAAAANPLYTNISAIMGTVKWGLLNPLPLTLVHNPMARTPLAREIFRATNEYSADDLGDKYLLRPLAEPPRDASTAPGFDPRSGPPLVIVTVAQLHRLLLVGDAVLRVDRSVWLAGPLGSEAQQRHEREDNGRRRRCG